MEVSAPYTSTDAFIYCGKCRMSICLLGQNGALDSTKNLINYQNGWFLVDRIENWEYNQFHELTNNESTVRSVYCKRCKTDIGFGLISLKFEDDKVKAGRFLLNCLKVRLWFAGHKYGKGNMQGVSKNTQGANISMPKSS